MADIDLNEDALEDDEASYDFSELWKAVQEQKDIILTIPKEQVQSLKIGLSSKKTKENKKLRDAGLSVPKDALEYLVYDDAETKDTPNTKVRIKYGPRTKINILKMEIPDDAL